MAKKTKEELKEMVDNTIVENGKGQITGHILNLTLTDIIDSMGSGDGGGLYNIYANCEIDENDNFVISPLEDLLDNYVSIFNLVANGNIRPAFLIMNDVEFDGVSMNMSGNAVYYGTDITGDNFGKPSVAFYLMTLEVILLLSEDGLEISE